MQEIFNRVVAHLLRQNDRSTDINGLCAYRGGDGLMCAVGCLISDEAYDPSFEGMSAQLPRVVVALEKSGITVTDDLERLLVRLQELHDITPVESWKSTLAKIATEFNLEMPNDAAIAIT
jgi:hypothetical protein